MSETQPVTDEFIDKEAEVFRRAMETIAAKFAQRSREISISRNNIWLTVISGLVAELTAFRKLERVLFTENAAPEALLEAYRAIAASRQEAQNSLKDLFSNPVSETPATHNNTSESE